MTRTWARSAATTLAALAATLVPAAWAQELDARLDALEAQVVAGEDVSAIKRLQRTYGYYLDKGMWADLAELYTDDAVANYPAGVYVGKESIRKHLFLNVGGVELGQIGLPDGRLYNHMNIQPVIHLDPGGKTAKGRWRAFAMFGSFGGSATWAEGVYEMTYEKVDGVWRIKTLDYYAGFAAPYATGWVPPEQRSAGAGSRGARNLPHPPDRPRSMACEGFPAACVPPFRYANPGTLEGGHVWTTVDLPERGSRPADLRDRAQDLAARAQRLTDEQAVENLQKIYGYYFDRRMWNEVADLFAENGTIEMGQRGVYVGKARVREFLSLLGPEGLQDGELNDHVQLQIVVDVAEDGRSAKLRSRELNMTGVHESHGEWSEGIYENTFVKENGVWKLKDLRYFPTFITDYDQGWANDAKPAPGPSSELRPDRPPTSVYEIFPKAHIPPYHYDNPVTGNPPTYGSAPGKPADAAIAAIRARVDTGRARREAALELEALVTRAEQQIARVKDYHELDNLESAYGYYLDKNLWNDLANLYAEDGSMELAQRGIYIGRERVRGMLFNVFGAEGPQEGRLGNHIQWQPVIHVAEDGRTANIRSRMMQQLNFGPRASMGASLYENEAVKENGVWKFKVVHTFNTWTAGYEGGWAKSPGRGVPGPSSAYPPDGPPTFTFQMFPTVYEIPFHYSHPVTGRQITPPPPARPSGGSVQSTDFGGMPSEIAAELASIGARIEVQRTSELYAPLQPKEPYNWVKLERDLAYGPHGRNVLDVFTAPAVNTAPKPVIVFVHGGGFARGAKRTEGTPFYDNVMLWAVGAGFVGVNINYRIAPEHTWPSGIEDLTQVVAWLEPNIASYGGDPGRVFLWGHSAGAAHVADYLARMANIGRSPRVAGAILTSGFYDLGSDVSVWQVYYGDDVSKYTERSSLPGLLKSSVPLLVTDAELDPDLFRQETEKLAAERARVGRPVERVHLRGHSHISETYAVGTADRSLSDPVREFVRRVSAGRARAAR